MVKSEIRRAAHKTIEINVGSVKEPVPLVVAVFPPILTRLSRATAGLVYPIRDMSKLSMAPDPKLRAIKPCADILKPLS